MSSASNKENSAQWTSTDLEATKTLLKQEEIACIALRTAADDFASAWMQYTLWGR